MLESDVAIYIFGPHISSFNRVPKNVANALAAGKLVAINNGNTSLHDSYATASFRMVEGLSDSDFDGELSLVAHAVNDRFGKRVPPPPQTVEDYRKVIEKLIATSPVVATITDFRIDTANGPIGANPIHSDFEELSDLLEALRHLAVYLIEDHSPDGCNLSPKVRREVVRYQICLKASKPIWYVLEDAVIALSHCRRQYDDDPWPGASRDRMDQLIVRTAQLKPLLKPDPKTKIIPPELNDDALSRVNLATTITTLEQLVGSPEGEVALTDAAKEYVIDAALELKEAQFSDSQPEKKKGIILVVTGFIWSALQVAGNAGRTSDGIAKLFPILQNVWQWFAAFLPR